MHVARFLPAAILRAFSIMGLRVRHLFGETPFLFFGVVLGVALLFRVGVGLARDAATPAAVAPTFVTTGPEPGLAAAAAPSPSTTSTPATAEVGAAAKVQPIGSPVRVPPKPRGHGRRPVH
ncbi:MAG TPA: hypothetical protein VLT33_16720 [Labilithrix sp.]|nr:hypothetical protein [Labilithrix sp.]